MTGRVRERVATALASSASSPVWLSSRRGPQESGKVESQPAPRVSAVRPARACRPRGRILDDPDRQDCDECLPVVAAERTAKRASAGRASLTAMRASLKDPARAPDAVARQRAKARAESQAAAAWERKPIAQLVIRILAVLQLPPYAQNVTLAT
jgi:hypothetical protein